MDKEKVLLKFDELNEALSELIVSLRTEFDNTGNLKDVYLLNELSSLACKLSIVRNSFENVFLDDEYRAFVFLKLMNYGTGSE